MFLFLWWVGFVFLVGFFLKKEKNEKKEKQCVRVGFLYALFPDIVKYTREQAILTLSNKASTKIE